MFTEMDASHPENVAKANFFLSFCPVSYSFVVYVFALPERVWRQTNLVIIWLCPVFLYPHIANLWHVLEDARGEGFHHLIFDIDPFPITCCLQLSHPYGFQSQYSLLCVRSGWLSKKPSKHLVREAPLQNEIVPIFFKPKRKVKRKVQKTPRDVPKRFWVLLNSNVSETCLSSVEQFSCLIFSLAAFHRFALSNSSFFTMRTWRHGHACI